MKEKTKLLTVSYLLFLLLLALSGYLDGVLSQVAYYGAFIIPVVLALYMSRSDESRPLEYLRLDREGVRILAVSAAPTIGAVWLFSFLTALLIEALTGKTDIPEVADTLPMAILTSALIPAVVEELLFRYLPMRLLAPFSRGRAVWLSAVFFAVAHMSPFSLVYAFFAGVIFMAIDLAAESIWPSVILHFVNNVVNIIMIFYPTIEVKIGVIVSLCLLFAITLPLFIVRRREVAEKFRSAFARGEQAPFDPVPLLFIIPAAVVGASVLF